MLEISVNRRYNGMENGPERFATVGAYLNFIFDFDIKHTFLSFYDAMTDIAFRYAN